MFSTTPADLIFLLKELESGTDKVLIVLGHGKSKAYFRSGKIPGGILTDTKKQDQYIPEV
jgi:hypothetical protein